MGKICNQTERGKRLRERKKRRKKNREQNSKKLRMTEGETEE